MTGGIAVGGGLLLIAIDIYQHHPGRAAEVAIFTGLVVVGFVVLGLLPEHVHPAGVTAIVIGIPGSLGWWWLPKAHRFADIRPFLLLTIAAYVACWVAPRTRGRVVFVAGILLFAWFWAMGEVAGSDAYSAAPIPSPPAHTIFSLAALHDQTGTVALGDLDPTDPLFPLAQQCDEGTMFACDSLFLQAPAGSDFQQFGGQCGSNNTSLAVPGECVSSTSGSSNFNAPPFRVSNTADNKATQLGIVSLLFGLVYLIALFAIDRRGWKGVATAFVLPCAEALFSGTELLGLATHHAYLGGAFTLVAALVFGAAGDRMGRRFTAWFGGFMAAFGSLVIALDLAHLRHSLSAHEFKLVKPGVVTIGAGVALVAIGYIVATFLAQNFGGGDGEGDGRAGDGGAAPEAPDPLVPRPGPYETEVAVVASGWPPAPSSPALPVTPPSAPPTPPAPPPAPAESQPTAPDQPDPPPYPSSWGRPDA